MGENEVSARSFGQLEGRVKALEEDRKRLNGSIDTLNKKMDTLNSWLIGAITTALVNVLMLLLNIVTR